MAKGMESNVSDDESDTTSLDDLVELVHEQKGMLKKQANEIKELNALNDLCDALGFQPELLTLMSRSTVLTLVKRRSTWAITSKTSPMTPNDPFWSTLVNPGSNPTQNPLNTPFALHCQPELLPRSPNFT
jgi:hypothetical protein